MKRKTRYDRRTSNARKVRVRTHMKAGLSNLPLPGTPRIEIKAGY